MSANCIFTYICCCLSNKCINALCAYEKGKVHDYRKIMKQKKKYRVIILNSSLTDCMWLNYVCLFEKWMF